MIARARRVLFRILRGEGPRRFQLWKERALRLGVRAVVNQGHPESAFEAVTEFQKAQLLPLLRAELSGRERTVLDFGCGPGRFTPDLAAAAGGCAIGLDPIEELLKLAPRSPRVVYAVMEPGRLPIKSGSIDVVFACLVVGGIPDRDLTTTAREIERVLRADGLLFLVENTAAQPDTEIWSYRSLETHQRLFSSLRVRGLQEYDDLGETITVMAGRAK